MRATEQYFPVVLFIMLYKVVLTFESVDEILKGDHSNESYWAVLSWGAVYFAVQDSCSFNGDCMKLLKWSPVERYFPFVLLFMPYVLRKF